MVKRSFQLLCVSMVISQVLAAQTVKQGTDKESQRYNDSVILADVVKPLMSKTDDAPNWEAFGDEINAKYGKFYVDRAVTKAKIFYYYGKDWPTFSKSLVHYTEAFENKDDLKLMNKNAKMVLKYSQDPEDWKAAMGWMKHVVDKEPGNAEYKETYDGLMAKNQ